MIPIPGRDRHPEFDWTAEERAAYLAEEDEP